MSKLTVIGATLVLSALLPASANATATEAVKSAGSKAVRGAEKGQNAVAHGLGVAAKGVEHGAKKAGEGVSHVAKKIGLPTTTGKSAPSPAAQTLPTSSPKGPVTP